MSDSSEITAVPVGATTDAPVAPPTQPTKRPLVLWDIVLTIVLLLAGAVIAIMLGVTAIGLGFAAPDECFVCNNTQIFFGQIFGMFGPPVLYCVFIILTIVRLVQRRRAFWVPIVGVVVAVLVLLGAGAMVFSAIPGFTFS
jgi:hypothetical protein